MTLTRFNALFVAILLATCIGGGACAEDNNTQQAELQEELEPLLATAPRAGAAGVATKVDASDCVAKTGPTDYRIPRSCFEALLGNPAEMASGARIVPSMKNGQGNGFKLYAIRPSSTVAHLGLLNGDTIQRINGMELSSMDKAVEIYTKLRTATRIEMELTRRGKPVTLSYSIP